MTVLGKQYLFKSIRSIFNANYYLEKIGFNYVHYDNTQDLFNVVKNEKTSSYCFGLKVDTFDVDND